MPPFDPSKTWTATTLVATMAGPGAPGAVFSFPKAMEMTSCNAFVEKSSRGRRPDKAWSAKSLDAFLTKRFHTGGEMPILVTCVALASTSTHTLYEHMMCLIQYEVPLVTLPKGTTRARTGSSSSSRSGLKAVQVLRISTSTSATPTYYHGEYTQRGLQCARVAERLDNFPAPTIHF